MRAQAKKAAEGQNMYIYKDKYISYQINWNVSCHLTWNYTNFMQYYGSHYVTFQRSSIHIMKHYGKSVASYILI